MEQLQVLNGYFSVYEILNRFGYTQPGKQWRKMLKEHRERLPEIQHLQFTMADGRKGRRTPAIHIKDYDQLVRLLDSVNWQQSEVSFHPAAEEEALSILMAAFQDLKPQTQQVLEGLEVDLFLPDAALAVRCLRSDHLPSRPLAVPSNFPYPLISFNPYETDFNVGEVVYQIRKLLDAAQQP